MIEPYIVGHRYFFVTEYMIIRGRVLWAGADELIIAEAQTMSGGAHWSSSAFASRHDIAPRNDEVVIRRSKVHIACEIGEDR